MANGQEYVSPALTTFLLNRGRRAVAVVEQQPALSHLTATERRILRLIAAYKTSKDIADELCLSARTVEHHRANICEKVGLKGSHALLKFASRINRNSNRQRSGFTHDRRRQPGRSSLRLKTPTLELSTFEAKPKLSWDPAMQGDVTLFHVGMQALLARGRALYKIKMK